MVTSFLHAGSKYVVNLFRGRSSGDRRFAGTSCSVALDFLWVLSYRRHPAGVRGATCGYEYQESDAPKHAAPYFCFATI
jgi:hypothetical protein